MTDRFDPARRLGAVLFVLALAAWGCSSDDTADDDAVPSTDPPADQSSGDGADQSSCEEIAAEVLDAVNAGSSLADQDGPTMDRLFDVVEANGEFTTTDLRCETDNTFGGPAEADRQALTASANGWNVALYFDEGTDGGPSWELVGFVEVGGGQ